MKIKLFCILMVLVLIFNCINTVGVMNSSELFDFNNKSSGYIQKKEIKAAIFKKAVMGKVSKFLYSEALEDYSWIAGNTKYTFVIDLITDKEVYQGDLTTDNYDILVVTAGGGTKSEWTKWMINRPLVKIWRNKMIKYILDGGGYYGVCGSTYFILDNEKPPRNLHEFIFSRSSLGVSCVKLESPEEPYSHIFFSQFNGKYNKIDPGLAYMYYSGWNFGSTRVYPGGLQFNITVNKNHSIFDDYLSDTVLISWIGGPKYVIPEEPDREVSVCAYFPNKEISDNEKTRIHYWKYTGGIKGLIQGYLRHVKNDKSLIGINFINTWWMASDWEKTDEIVTTNFSGKPLMTAEVYPNENKSRIFLTSAHPEFGLYFGAEVFEFEDTDNNNLYDGLIGLRNYTDPNETEEDERTFTWWIIRRAVAWAAKVPDNDLPPIHGPSQVSDIYPYNQSINFKIYGNSEVSEEIASLELYYRYSSDDGKEDPWSNWTLYDTDVDFSDGLSWNFISPEGTGYYQFYSIRHIKYAYEELIEKAPDGPDAIAYVHE